jgi:hypothetical protein
MRKSACTPSIVPNDNDQNVYIVLDDFGRTGRAYRETDAERPTWPVGWVEPFAKPITSPRATSASSARTRGCGGVRHRADGGRPSLSPIFYLSDGFREGLNPSCPRGLARLT